VVDEAERASPMEWEDDSQKAILIEAEGLEEISKIYEAWISLYGESNALHGVLYEIQDSSVLFSYSTSKVDYLSGNFAVSKIRYKDIKIIRIRRKGSAGKGAVIGAVAGFLLGVG